MNGVGAERGRKQSSDDSGISLLFNGPKTFSALRGATRNRSAAAAFDWPGLMQGTGVGVLGALARASKNIQPVVVARFKSCGSAACQALYV